MQSCCDSDEHLLEQDFVAPDRKTKRALKHDICTTSKLGLSWAAHKGLTSISTVRLPCYLLLSPELQGGYNDLCLRAFRTRCGLQCIGAVLLMDRREMRLWPEDVVPIRRDPRHLLLQGPLLIPPSPILALSEAYLTGIRESNMSMFSYSTRWSAARFI